MNLYGHLVASAARFPQRPAVAEPARAVTFTELLGRVDDFARRLVGHECRAGDTIGIQFPNSIACAVAVFAASKVSATILMLDPALKVDECSRACAQAGDCLLLQPDSAPVAGEDLICVTPLQRGVSAHPPAVSSEDDSVLLLSSGTSGLPKIVCRTAGPALRIFRDTLPFHEDGDRVLASLPFFHSFGFSYVLGAALAGGATLHIAPFTPRETAALIERERLTIVPASPLAFRLLAQTRFQRSPDFSSVRLAVSAGSALPPAILAECREKFGIKIAQSYGTTESGPIALGRAAEYHDQAGWVGRPYEGVTIEILAPDGRRLGPDDEGEIAVLSPANGTGYLHVPESSASIFRQGRVVTGDLGSVNSAGHLFVAGRRKFMLNIAGKKVSPAEVEECLLQHPAIADALVGGTAATDGDDRIKATVVTKGAVTALEIQEFCSSRLADFKVPRHIEFVQTIDRGPMGKSRAAT